MLAFLLPLGYGIVCEVGQFIYRHAIIRGTVDVPHGDGEVKSHQLCVAGGILGDDEGDRRDVLHPHPQPNVGVFQVYLAEVDWP